MSKEARKEFEATYVITRLKAAQTELEEAQRMMRASLIPQQHKRMLQTTLNRIDTLARNLREWRHPELKATRKRNEKVEPKGRR